MWNEPNGFLTSNLPSEWVPLHSNFFPFNLSKVIVLADNPLGKAASSGKTGGRVARRVDHAQDQAGRPVGRARRVERHVHARSPSFRGRITDPSALGTLALLRAGAHPVGCAQDVLELINE